MEGALIPHLFRTEFNRIVAVLCRQAGSMHLQAAEDIAADTFMAAVETWPYRGIPANPAGWLHQVAKNKAINYFRRDAIYGRKIRPALAATPAFTEPDTAWTEDYIADSQLRMMFALCHPAVPVLAQVTLCLRILCGFSVPEISDALLNSTDAIHKQLQRARQTLRSEQIGLELPPAGVLASRLDKVLLTLYLLFSEGYYSERNNQVIRQELCAEAMRLTRQLADHPLTQVPATKALLALMCFQASRLQARKGGDGALVFYQQQDRSAWNPALISRGASLLNEASGGDVLSRFHLEASIAWWLCCDGAEDIRWKNILALHDLLLQHFYSPVAALNRLYALSRVHGREAALAEAVDGRLPRGHFYYVLLAELHAGVDDRKAGECYRRALTLAKSDTDRETITGRLAALGEPA
jgi:RNA polymerase sigma factor (sigma-70 family)